MAETSNPAPRPTGFLEVARQEKAVLIRVRGLGNMNISLTMKDFVKESIAHGFRYFALDLQDCGGLDSTFMGTIVAVCFRVREAGGWLCLLNVKEECRRLLQMLGVWGMVPVRESFPIAAVETEPLLPGGDAARRMKHIRLAHEHLLHVDERNKERFGDFLAALESEMAADTNTKKNEPASAPLAKTDSEKSSTEDVPSRQETPVPPRRLSDTSRLDRLKRFAKGGSDTPPSEANTGTTTPKGTTPEPE